VSVVSLNVEDIYGLSPLQEGMLFHTLAEPHAALYFLQAQSSLSRVDVPALQEAWHQVLDRHPALRTSFHWEGLAKPVQVVQRQVPLPLEVYDWRGVPPAEQEANLQTWLLQDRSRGFVLFEPPLMRLTLFRMTDRAYHFVWSHHHIILDGWSHPLVLEEARRLYAAIARGQDLSLPAPRPYRDHIAWLQRQDVVKAEPFWRARLQGIRAPTPLPLDRGAGRRPGPNYRVEHRERRLSEEHTAPLRALARRLQVTMNTLVQGAWALLLSRYSGLEEVVYGTTVSGRPHELEGVERMVGLFINTLPMRVPVPVDEPLQAWLKRLHASQFEMQQYEYSPLVQVQAWSEVPAGTPLFESLFVFENYPSQGGGPQRQRGGSQQPRRQIQAPADRTNYPLALLVGAGQGLNLRLIYDTSRFDAATISQLLERLQVVLTAMADDPDSRLGDLPLMSAIERHYVLVGWNETHAPPVGPATAAELFEVQAARTPEAVAAVFGDRTLTYVQLSQMANRLARRLRALGVGPDVAVGLCVERSLEMIVGLLGILKAGGAYVPLDPEYPRERLAFMLQDAHAPVLLTQERLLSILPISSSAQVLCLDEDWPAVEREDGKDLAPTAAADNLAYVIYTSGSTGRPKGVTLPHRALVNLIRWHNTTLARGVPTLQFASLSFDASFHELFAAWASGGSVHVLPEQLRRDIPALARYLREREVEKAILPVTVLQELAEEYAVSKELPTHLRELITTGEQLHITAQVGWLCEQLPDCQLHNHYGPSETHVVTAQRLMGPPASWPSHPPIGQPISNTQAFVLDERMRPVPVGVPGELYFGGEGLGRGYLNHPDLTAERFVPDPFGGPGTRLYRTGDLARWLPDSSIEYLGRIDDQVKVRGVRVELGEVETVLGRHHSIRQAVVLAEREASGTTRLVAYVVPAQEPAPSAGELRAFLQESLPDHMIPSTFLILPALPLNANGKVDRRALAATAPDRLAPSSAYVAPRTPTEEMMAGIWSEILQVPQVGVYDSFFELGGHSLLATRIISRLRNASGIEVPFHALFEAPTVVGLAAQIERIREGTAKAAPGISRQELSVVGVQAPSDSGSTKTAPQSFAQQRLWFLGQLAPGASLYNTMAVLPLRGVLDLGALERALGELVRRHESLRTTFGARDGEPIQIVAPPAPVRVSVVDLRGLSRHRRQAELQRLRRVETAQPFDLARGPLVRFTLVWLDEQRQLLLVGTHHIITDGWSMGVLRREVDALYGAFRAGESCPLPELPLQYADFAIWQRHWLQGEVLRDQLAYWRQQLAGAEPLELPTDRPRPPVPRYAGARQSFGVAPEVAGKLRELGQQEEATLFMVLLAAFQVVLGRYSGQDDVIVGTPIANRVRVELEGLIGLFVNTLVLRTDLSGDPSFRMLLRRVRRTCLGAYAHQDLPFENLVGEVAPQRDLSVQPLLRVLCVLQSTAQAGAKPTRRRNTTANEEPEPAGSIYFDLTLSLTETASGLSGALHFNTDLFDLETAQRLVLHFRTLLEGVADQPDEELSSISMMPEHERRQLVSMWHPSAPALPTGCIHHLVEEQAEHAPDQPAVTLEDLRLSYGDLDRRSNQVAHRLGALGVGPEVPVGLYLDRGPDAIVGLLGILKAGGVYLPLDPGLPQERLAWLLGDARPAVVLTQQALDQGLPECQAAVLCLDDPRAGLDDEPDSRPLVEVSPGQLAYIIYTSGSTGHPKGVMVEHRSLSHTIRAQLPLFDLNPDSRVLATIALSFDASLGEIFRTLAAGATLCLARREELLPGPGLIGLLRDQRITATSLVTAVLAALPTEDVPELRTLTVGGEALPAELAARWSRGRRVLNGYGPTETTIGATLAHRWDPDRKPPLGRPLPDVRAYVLDARMRLLPVGVPGELYLGGPGLARGYLCRPGLTAERFLPDPFGIEPGARMYRTGDRVRWQTDGQLDFLGRVDDQVKIRGHRVELGEIEVALGRHPGVHQAAVTMREDTPGPKRLIGYVVPDGDGEPAAADLRGYLRKALPEYMVPAAFVVLPALPMTPNGKLDRQALPVPSLNAPAPEEAYVPPRTATETVLADIWADLLRLERVGINDNYFELGGDSIQSIQMTARANQAGLSLTPKDLFQYQTIAELAAAAGASGAQAAGAVSADQGPVSGEVPLTPIEHWFFEQDRPEPHHFNWATTLQVPPDLEPGVVKDALQALMEHHDVLRLRVVSDGSQWRQRIAPPEGFPVTLLQRDLSGLSENEQREAVVAAAGQLQADLDLSRGPLLRAALFRGAPGRPGRLLLILHHLALDWISWGIVQEDMRTALRLLRPGKSVQLPPKTTSFKYWAESLIEYARSESLHQQRSYWLDPRRGEITPLPVDHPGGVNSKDSVETVSVALEPEETRVLLQEVPRVYKTQINDVLLMALAMAVGRWTGGTSVLVDLEGHGREDIGVPVDLSRTVGWFTSYYPLLLDLDGVSSVGDALKAVKEQLRQVPNRGIGYGVLRYLSPDLELKERLRALPKAEVCFNYMGKQDRGGSRQPAAHQKQRRGQFGAMQSQKGRRSYLFEINGGIRGSHLQVNWGYSTNLHGRSTVETVAEGFIAALREVIAHCQSAEAGGRTPSDYPLAHLTQSELDSLLYQLARQPVEESAPVSDDLVASAPRPASGGSDMGGGQRSSVAARMPTPAGQDRS
jgi:amino acid adenylation domain-containing protein/non-ribosomal peptide synthase protein (TIGR01720 family)